MLDKPQVKVLPTGQALGAEVIGVDLSSFVLPEHVSTIRQAFLDYSVIFFKNQKLTDQQLVNFSGIFGKVMKEDRTEGMNRELGTDLPDYVDIISSVKVEGKSVGQAGLGELQWHTDTLPLPNGALILHAWEAPDSGSTTRFASGYAAYDALPVDVKKTLEGKILIHSRAIGLEQKAPNYDTDLSEASGPWFPIVRQHGDTGRKSLFLGREGQGHIVGMDWRESNQLLKYLWEHQVKNEFRWEHNWSTGDVLVWDNRCTVHSRGPFEGRRVLHRTTVSAEWPQFANI